MSDTRKLHGGQLLVFASWLLAFPLHAALFQASDAGQLIAAINAANATLQVDVIELQADITLSAVDNVTDEANGLPVVTTPIILLGNGHTLSRDGAAPPFRFFNVKGAFFGDGELTLDDLTLNGGDITPPGAGNCFIMVVGCGGAVFNHFGHVVARNNTRFVHNHAYAGGALFNAGGKFEAVDVHFVMNYAELGAAAYSMGGLIGDPARLDIRNGNFHNNEALFGGGGIWNSATVNITDSSFTDNRVSGVPLFGGGGGAAHNNTFNGLFTVTNSTFTGNEAVRGGALSNFNASDMTLRNVEVSGNRAINFGSGGGIWSDNNTDLAVHDSRVNDNQTDATILGHGGGIYSGQNNSLTLENSEVSGNTAGRDGGGIYMSSINAAVHSFITNSHIDANQAGGDGGGIYKEGASPLTIVASSISDNVNTGLNGGGLAVVGGIVIPPQGVRISDSTIARNQMITGDGGGISNENQGVIVIERSTIADNEVTGFGGVSGLGGGVFSNQTNSSVTITNTTLSGNTAQSNGGGLYNNNASNMTVAHATITANTAGLQGGGIHPFATLTISDSIIAGNVANHPVNPHQNNCGGLPAGAPFIIDGGGNFTDDIGTACPPTFTQTAVLNLQPLADNGGPTQTHALGAGSAAIDGGVVCASAEDQRGVAREPACDSGAYEGDVVVPVVRFAATNSSVDENPGGAHPVQVILDNSAGTLGAGVVDVHVALTGSASPGGIDYARVDLPPLRFSGADWPAPGATSTLPVDLDVVPDFFLEGDETLLLSLQDSGISGPADVNGADTHTVTIVDALSDLAIAKSVALTTDLGAPGLIEPGDEITYTVTLANLGPYAAENVVVEDVLDSVALDLGTATIMTTLGVFDAASGEWSVDGAGTGAGFDLLPGQSEILTVAATVLPAAAQTVYNTAALSRAFPPRAADPDASNDSATVGFGLCDATLPEISVSVAPDTLWPPQHQRVTVAATVTASDDSGVPPTVSLVSVTSNEPDEGLGDGDTASDIVIQNDTSFELRAERSGRGSGRVYTITYSAEDSCGNQSLAQATVTVPKSQKR